MSDNNIDNPAKLILNYRRLMDTKRCNNFSVVHKEDVAHHSYFVTMIAVLIAKDYNNSILNSNSKPDNSDDNNVDAFDIPSIYEKGMFHDIEEAFFSDIPRNIKHHNKEVNSAIENAVKEKLSQIYDGSGVTGKYALECNSNAKAGKEGQLIDIVDMLELGIYCSEEVNCGNNLMTSLRDKAAMLVSKNDLFNDLMDRSSLFSDLYNVISSDTNKMIEKFRQSIDIN